MICGSFIWRCLSEQEASLYLVLLQKPFPFGFAVLLIELLNLTARCCLTDHIFNTQGALRYYSVYIPEVYNFLEPNSKVLPWLLWTEIPLWVRGVNMFSWLELLNAFCVSRRIALLLGLCVSNINHFTVFKGLKYFPEKGIRHTLTFQLVNNSDDLCSKWGGKILLRATFFL